MDNPVALVVDDEPDIRELLSLTLGRMDIETVAAEDLGSARKALGRKTLRYMPDRHASAGWRWPGAGRVDAKA